MTPGLTIDPHDVVPPSGYSARLTLLTCLAMGFLAVFALSLCFAAGRVADLWADALAGSATIRISAPVGQVAAQTDVVLRVLDQTPGVASARALDRAEQEALLAPWFGSDLELGDLPIPQLIELEEDTAGYDAEGLRQRLAAEAPGALLDDHSRWRAPLVIGAKRLRLMGWTALVLIAAATAAMVTLAAGAALSANERVIRTLRLVGATDSFIIHAFVRRFTLRAAIGAAIGMALAAVAVALMPGAGAAEGFLTGMRFRGAEWLWPLLVPPVAAGVAYAATDAAARRMLKGLP